MKIGFLGTGIMGGPMAAHLVDNGHEVYVDGTHRVPKTLRDRVYLCNSAEEVARQTELIILMVPDTPDVEQVLFGESGVAAGLSNGKIVIDMSSISPVETKIFAQKINDLGCKYLDAPVSGGQVGAENATLTIMVGGDQETFTSVLPVLKLLGTSITLVGSNGDGQTCKVANQIIVALTIEAVGEALLFASKAGADPAKVREALMGGFASSKILEVHGERMIQRTFAPGFRISLHQKDLNLALASARALQIALPNTATAQELFNAVAAQGESELDHSALVLALEKLAEHKIGR
ncbi:MAG: 2-hydroxy-3-oxopropionate reductase [Desulfocapsaceae bacterium]|jgi:2-hydroxy-3-oxopropionate reductase|nr:2-hydroxy-3-oxopropionate reductase [Desulfocapsaceae bacterium]